MSPTGANADSEAGAGRRFVVFPGPHVADSTLEAIEALALAFPKARFFVVRAGNPIRGKRWWRNKWRRLKREPLSYPLELLAGVAGKLRRSRLRPVTSDVGLPDIAAGDLANVEQKSFDRLHGEESLAAIRAFEPWLGISIGAPILYSKLFTIPTRGTINVHKSLLPEFRGMPSGFWELHDDATKSGVSVHWVEKGLDTGTVLGQRALEIDPYTTPAGLLARLDALSIDVLIETVRDLDRGGERELPQSTPKTPTRSRPAWLVAARVARKTAARRQPSRGALGWLREWIKRAVMRGYVSVWAPLRNAVRSRRGTNRAVVLLYHRVSDEFVDKVTVGVEQFQRQLRILRSRYDVVDLATLIRARGKPRRRPVVALTFDDGYVDNYLAARLLRRAEVPCTFFVCTHIVGSDQPFEHDMRKVGKRVPALSWEQVDTMANWGFSISNHTATHANVGRVAHETALDEIRTARQDLVERFGECGPERWFAYTFGRRSDITESVREALPGLGIDVCCSAYGGTNAPDFPLLDVRRVGLGANVSDLGFRAIVEGWPTQMKQEDG